MTFQDKISEMGLTKGSRKKFSCKERICRRERQVGARLAVLRGTRNTIVRSALTRLSQRYRRQVQSRGDRGGRRVEGTGSVSGGVTERVSTMGELNPIFLSSDCF